MFLDLEISDNGATAELLLQPNDSLAVAAIKDFRDSIKLGDELKVGGSYEQAQAGSSGVFLVSSVRTVSTWKDTHPNEHFVHRPIRNDRQPEVPGSDQGGGPYQAARPGTTIQACQEQLTDADTAQAASNGETGRPAVRSTFRMCHAPAY